jgi:hypothetical protein
MDSIINNDIRNEGDRNQDKEIQNEKPDVVPALTPTTTGEGDDICWWNEDDAKVRRKMDIAIIPL